MQTIPLNIIVWDADCVSDYGKIPEPGDEIEVDTFGEKQLIISTTVINKRKVEIKTYSLEEIEDIEMIGDPCKNWKEIDDKYLPRTKTNVLENGLGVR